MANGQAGISAISKASGSDVSVYNIGIKYDVEHPSLKNILIKKGTHNFLFEPAMSEDDTVLAILKGIEIVKEHIDLGYNLFGTGEMGIGNTTTSSAVIMSILDLTASEAVGKGAGLTDEGLEVKKSVIQEAILKYDLQHQDPLRILACVGGFDIAGLVGVFIGCAYYRMPVVIDGVISSAAALIAYSMCPSTLGYMIPSHCTVEPAYAYVMKHLGLSPLLQLDMRLGEGTGCPLAFQLLETSCEIVRSIVPFADINVTTDYMIDLRHSH
jgi:nicotinate-nucleotide--dimethylbenzimidazole phosphoribosyltransferase